MFFLIVNLPILDSHLDIQNMFKQGSFFCQNQCILNVRNTIFKQKKKNNYSKTVKQKVFDSILYM